MSDNQMPSTPNFNTSPAVTISNGVLLASLIFLFLVVAFVFLLYLYARRHMSPGLLSSQAHFTFVGDNLPVTRRGLDSAVLQTLPVKVFDVKEFKDGLECSVCLSDIAEGEEVRILPKCSHGFHVKCIDMWFHSHSTCPLCRSAVGTDSVQTEDPNAESAQGQSLDAVSREGFVTEPRVLPTNVLFWGTQDDVSNGTVQEATSSSMSNVSRKRGGPDTLVIDIPRRAMENIVPSPISPLPPSVMPLEELKSPVSARFKSLKRLLSRGKQVVGPSASPRGGDIEQGIVHTPKTPKSFQG